MSESPANTKAGRRGIALAASALLALPLLLPATSRAALYDPVGQGATTIHLAAPFARDLRRAGVKLKATQGAKLKGRSVRFPAEAGRIEPARGLGKVKHGGALQLTRGPRKILIRRLIFQSAARRSPLAAKVGGGQIKLATSRPVRVGRLRFGIKAKAVGLLLTANLASRLDRKLGVGGAEALKAGEPLGTAVTVVEPSLAAIASTGRLDLTPDQGLLDKLNALHVALNPIFPAEHLNGVFSFPIDGGRIAPDGSSGYVATQGSLEALQLGGGQIFWREPFLELESLALSAEADVEPAPPYPGKVGRLAVAGLTLTGLDPEPNKRTVKVSGTVALSGDAAGEMNEAYAQGKPEFSAGETLGSVSGVVVGE